MYKTLLFKNLWNHIHYIKMTEKKQKSVQKLAVYRGIMSWQRLSDLTLVAW